MPHELKYTRRSKVLRPTKATNTANRTSIRLRPAEADGRRFGDWETDITVDSYGHAILTLTERPTNFILTDGCRMDVRPCLWRRQSPGCCSRIRETG